MPQEHHVVKDWVEEQTRSFVTRPTYVQAIQVTEENIYQVATWCGGHVHTEGTKYIDVPMNSKKPEERNAYVGRWITRRKDGVWRVYTNKSFIRNFLELNKKTERS